MPLWGQEVDSYDSNWGLLFALDERIESLRQNEKQAGGILPHADYFHVAFLAGGALGTIIKNLYKLEQMFNLEVKFRKSTKLPPTMGSIMHRFHSKELISAAKYNTVKAAIDARNFIMHEYQEALWGGKISEAQAAIILREFIFETYPAARKIIWDIIHSP